MGLLDFKNFKIKRDTQETLQEGQYQNITPIDSYNETYEGEFNPEETKNFYNEMRRLYAAGKIKKLTPQEREILEFCHERDMKDFLREEFAAHPIKIADDVEPSPRWNLPTNNRFQQPLIVEKYSTPQPLQMPITTIESEVIQPEVTGTINGEEEKNNLGIY